MSIDRRTLVRRHRVVLNSADPGVVLSVGNGDFGFTTDATGLQTFTDWHQPDVSIPDGEAPRVTNTCTLSSWGWEEHPNPEGFRFAEAVTDHQTVRGPVPYADRPAVAALMSGSTERQDLAGLWFVQNPHRLDLGRVGLILRPRPGAEPETNPSALRNLEAALDLWAGEITSRFEYLGQPVEVVTAAHGKESTVATRVTSPLLATGQLSVGCRFGSGSTHFVLPVDWDAEDQHTSVLKPGLTDLQATIHRCLSSTRYDVDLSWSRGQLVQNGPHQFELSADSATLELAVRFQPVAGPGRDLALPTTAPVPSFDQVRASSRALWNEFWQSGAVVDFTGSTHSSAVELERRVVLSQYLTRLHCAGVTPPQETGFVTNSWQGKSHLEMHWWHAAHFAGWGRPELLERALGWYESIHNTAKSTARKQGYAGARWPKQVGPDGRESPSGIGSFLIWQQPHLLYFAEMLWRAHHRDPQRQAALAHRLAPLLADTAEFMVDYASESNGVFHLGPPLMPAQEFYAATDTADPTFELAYWAWGLETAQRFRERQGLERVPEWDRVNQRLASPAVTDGHYAAVANEAVTRTDDHPSMALALGFVPQTRIIEPAIMERTLDWVLENWEWDSAWGWDFPALAMTASRLGKSETALDILVSEARKNYYDAAGHNPQMGSFLPVYLPGNGGLLAAVSLLLTQAEGTDEVYISNEWRIRHEGLIRWP